MNSIREILQKRLIIQTYTFLHSVYERMIRTPFGIQNLIYTLFLLLLMSFRPNYHSEEGTELFGYETADAANISLKIRENGFFENNNTIRTAGLEVVEQTGMDGIIEHIARPKKRDKTIEYKVLEKDTITKVAHKYAIKVSTLLWANDLSAKDTLQNGQILRIPPVDGVYYKASKGDDIAKIITAFNVNEGDVYAMNSGLDASKPLDEDREIFLPNAQKVYVAMADLQSEKAKEALIEEAQKDINTNANTDNKPTVKPLQEAKYVPKTPVVAVSNVSNKESDSVDTASLKFVNPTKGSLTQGYKKGHLALDIANKWDTPIYAARGGKVITSSDGWNGGYGNYIIIDHGDGVQTLYGHNHTRLVEVGDTVKAGQLIALMGNSGRVFGRTGIHLHFEIHINGRKVNPSKYL